MNLIHFYNYFEPFSVAANSLGPPEVRQALKKFLLHQTYSPHDRPKYLTKKIILKTFNLS